MRSIRAVSRLSLIAAIVAMAGIGARPTAAQDPSGAKPSPSPSPSPEARGTRPGDVQKVFILKHVGVNDMARLLSVFPAAFGGADRPGLAALSVSAAPAVVAAIEETLKRLDVPPPPVKSVEVTGFLLECSGPGAEAGSAPAELQPAISQLKRTFAYAGCELAQTLFARARDGARFSSTSTVKDEDHPGRSERILEAEVGVDSSQSPALVRFRGLRFSTSSAGGAFTGDVAVRDGQQIVLGKLGPGNNGKDRVLVLTAKVVD
jgi:hypothetical protein